MIWCASVVLPLPGAPASRLKENSGSPPPSTTSRPGTPVARRRMVAFSVFMEECPVRRCRLGGGLKQVAASCSVSDGPIREPNRTRNATNSAAQASEASFGDWRETDACSTAQSFCGRSAAVTAGNQVRVDSDGDKTPPIQHRHRRLADDRHQRLRDSVPPDDSRVCDRACGRCRLCRRVVHRHRPSRRGRGRRLAERLSTVAPARALAGTIRCLHGSTVGQHSGSVRAIANIRSNRRAGSPFWSVEQYQVALLLGGFDVFQWQCCRTVSVASPDDVDQSIIESFDQARSERDVMCATVCRLVGNRPRDACALRDHGRIPRRLWFTGAGAVFSGIHRLCDVTSAIGASTTIPA
jgi:hypothetical protein